MMRLTLAAGVLVALLMGCQTVSSISGAEPVDTTGWSIKKPISQTGFNDIGAESGAQSGWVASGPSKQTTAGLTSTGAGTLTIKSAQTYQAPIEATFLISLEETSKWATLTASAPDSKVPALTVRLMRSGDQAVTIGCEADGQKLETQPKSSRPYMSRETPSGSEQYKWRFEKTRNVWTARDRAEIGASYAGLTPFPAKTFAVRMVILPDVRQVWVDDRFIGEFKAPAPSAIEFAGAFRAGATFSSVALSTPDQTGKFTPLATADLYGQPTPGRQHPVTIDPVTSVPMRLSSDGTGQFDLGKTLYRYRMTFGTGPNAPYVNANRAWPSGLDVDPLELTMRVPFRPYQNIWLTAWIDDSNPVGIPKGTVRFYKEYAGYPASSDFEITEDAHSKGLVRKLNQTTSDGKSLYLIKVPVNTNAFYGLIDSKGSNLDLQISKPVTLNRGYPDPIYYGEHPAGPPSSLRVTSITLEESAFDYEVKPRSFAHTFERPGQVLYDVLVTNTSDKPLEANVKLGTESYDKSETQQVSTKVLVPANASQTATLDLSALKRLGWHKLDVQVDAGGETRKNTLSLVLLPPNTRTYGDKPEEIRFGSWDLLGHYTPLSTDKPKNDVILELYRKLGIRMVSMHLGFFTPEQFKKYDLLPNGPHTIVSIYHRLKEQDPEQMKKMLADELKGMEAPYALWDKVNYYYGGEWYYDHVFPYGPNPRYTGKGPYQFSEAVQKNIRRQMVIFTAIGKEMRKQYPKASLILQWGGPALTIGFMEFDFPKDIVDAYGMDAPMFELTPELPTGTGTINGLWSLRKEAERMGWPQLPIRWCEGPFLNTNPGALTLQEQEENYVRYYMHGLAYGIDQFEGGVVPFDAGNYYGAEHYGAGVYERIPFVCPKPAVAAIATTTRKLCNAKVIGPVDTGVLTTYAMGFTSAEGKPMYVVWRASGSVEATLSTGPGSMTVTDSMGNESPAKVVNGKPVITITTSPIWVEGAAITAFKFAAPVYEEKPAPISSPVVKFDQANWSYDSAALPSYENNHFGTARTMDLGQTANFAKNGGDKATVTLVPQPEGDRPLAIRYGSLVLKKPVPLAGKPSALGVWVDGNSSWGRVIYELQDAKGETWTSIGTKNDWNCDDGHTWSYVKFEGRKYVRFPLPGNASYDKSRDLESTWWKSEHGDGVVDLPLSVSRIIVETRNESLYLGQLKLVPNRSYALSGLTVEYASEFDKTQAVIDHNNVTMAIPEWTGPTDNLIERLREKGGANPPTITRFDEPVQFNDGRQMIIHFTEDPKLVYKLYISVYPDGRGAELLDGAVKDGKSIRGFQPGLPVYLFMTQTGADKIESKPSAAFKIVTEDKFAEK